VEQVLTDVDTARISEKLKALLHIAAGVTRSGTTVSEQLINRAREAGATDREIHDTVLVAAAFNMFNRYVDGLSTEAPADLATYKKRGKIIAEQGYIRGKNGKS